LDDIGLEFAALSYVWGDESKTRDILVNGHRRAVTTNLESALRNFRHNFRDNSGYAISRFNLVEGAMGLPHGLTRLRRYLASKDCLLHGESDIDEEGSPEDEDDVNGADAMNTIMATGIVADYQRVRVGGGLCPIWVDALCINQGDLVEKSCQISMMQDIYAKADCVFSWLGPSDDRKIDLALRTIRKLTVRLHSGKYSTSQLRQDYPELCRFQYPYSPFNDDWKAIQNFADCEYFQRIWIMQELWATNNAIFLCGDEYLPMQALCSYHLWAYSHTMDTINNKNESLVPPLSMPIFPPITQVYAAKAGFEGTWVKTRARRLLEIARSWHCKDPRDKVFALRAILRMDITPDYTMSVADVYAKWATNSPQDIPLGALLSYSGIGLSPRAPGSHKLASWQPDLAILGEQLKGRDVPNPDTEVPYRFKPNVSQTRCFTCFGIRVAVVREVAGYTSKETISHTVGNDLRIQYLKALKYLITERRRVWTPDYHTKGSMLWMFVQTLNERMDYGSGPPIPDLTPDVLSAFSPRNIFKRARKQLSVLRKDDLVNFTVEELSFLGFKSEEELWDCLRDLPTDSGDRVNLQPDPGFEGTRGDPLCMFLIRAKPLLRTMILFHTDDGLLGVGPTGMEKGDMVYLIHGSSFPVLIRQVDDKLCHVGVCYLSGISDAESRRVLKERECDVRELKLV
jgi:hypothetical protein